MSTKPSILQITWIDSALAPSSSVYTQADAIDGSLVTLVTVGHLVFEDDGQVCLAASKHGSKDWRGVQWIPKVNITEREELGQIIYGELGRVDAR